MDQPESALVPSVLVAPLDWGLGHATRCIPLVRELLGQGSKVILAASGVVKNLLQQEFPQLLIVDLKGYDISYSKNKWSLPFVVASQIPKILSVIQYENEQVKTIVKAHKIDGIISDNRYGLYHSGIASVFLTHQLLIKTGLGKTADEYLQRLNYRYIDRFAECWIPDTENENCLAGDLSHPSKLPSVPVKYLGPLSRLSAGSGTGNKHLLIIISGPEPQRTIFEDLLLSQLQEWSGSVVLVRGLPATTEQLKIKHNIFIHNHLSSKDLNQLMNDASFIISRCGYSTVMDLAAIRKKSILVPTPGQTEQEYLASHLMKNNFALTIDQQKFKLKAAVDLAENFHYKFEFLTQNYLQSAVRSFLCKIRHQSET